MNFPKGMRAILDNSSVSLLFWNDFFFFTMFSCNQINWFDFHSNSINQYMMLKYWILGCLWSKFVSDISFGFSQNYISLYL
jgi:hypothetical protein